MYSWGGGGEMSQLRSLKVRIVIRLKLAFQMNSEFQSPCLVKGPMSRSIESILDSSHYFFQRKKFKF